jgi:hypothetical protein
MQTVSFNGEKWRLECLCMLNSHVYLLLCKIKQNKYFFLDFKMHDCVQSLLDYTSKLTEEIQLLKNGSTNCMTYGDFSKNEFNDWSADTIKSRIENIGMQIVDYGRDLQVKSKIIVSNFAINRNGFVVVSCRCDDDFHHLLLYKPNGELVKKTVTKCYQDSGSAIGISDDSIFLASFKKHESIKHRNYFYIDSFDLNLCKTRSFADRVSLDLSEIDHIAGCVDFSNNRIYVKIQVNGDKYESVVIVNVFDTRLNQIDRFVIEETRQLKCRLKIKNNFVAYVKEKLTDADYNEIVFKSLKTRDILSKLDFNKARNIDFDMCPNGNLFTLAYESDDEDDDDMDANCSLYLKEYNLNGKLVQSTGLNIRLFFDRKLSSPNYKMCITERFNFAVMSADEKCIFLN